MLLFLWGEFTDSGKNSVASLQSNTWNLEPQIHSGGSTMDQSLCVHIIELVSLCVCVFGWGPHESSPHPEGSSASSPQFKNNQQLYCSRKPACCLASLSLSLCSLTCAHTNTLPPSPLTDLRNWQIVLVTPWLWGKEKKRERESRG